MLTWISHKPSSVMMKLFLLFLVILPLVLSYPAVDEWEEEKRALFGHKLTDIVNSLKPLLHADATKSACVSACQHIPRIGMFSSLCGVACDQLLHIVR
ncbi:hypothetical protein ScPMuIL_000293 [Solemya velum]